MHLSVQRYNSGEETTHGLLFDSTGPAPRQFLCYTLEDQHRDIKVAGDTRIPAGTYEVTLRTVGGKHAKYAQRYPDMHKGMLWVRNVPGFEFILIHVGNDEADTEGCLLVGNTAGMVSIGASRDAYTHIYPLIADKIAAGERVTITYTD